jgi:transposase InsO family protein
MDWKITWRSVENALGDSIPTRLVQWATARFKARRARHAERHRQRARVQSTVHAPDVIWGLDGSHVGRTTAGEALESQTLRDHATRRTIDLGVGACADGGDVVQLLEHARETRGTLPLVLVTDNAPNNTSEEVERYLDAHQVIHLLTLPYTPQHNAPTERAHRELKELAGLGKGVVLDGAKDAAQRLASAWHHLDHRHARPALGGRTAADAYQDLTARARIPDRERFYWTTRHALDVASQPPTAHQRRRARREAIYASLERFELVSRTRGGEPFRAIMCEGIS